ncbi:MAG: cupin domain-containing protein [Planctomycetota bacterium]
MSKAELIREPDAEREKHNWGTMIWYCGGERGRSEEMTFAQCELLPDCKTREHHHEECEEIIHVVNGIVRHHMAGERDFLELSDGDTLVIPPCKKHQIENIGDEQASIIMIWSSANLEIVEEE